MNEMKNRKRFIRPTSTEKSPLSFQVIYTILGVGRRKSRNWENVWLHYQLIIYVSLIKNASAAVHDTSWMPKFFPNIDFQPDITLIAFKLDKWNSLEINPVLSFDT